jgi:hypothetical protein
MKKTQRNTYVLRDGVMNVLSDEEVARIGTSKRPGAIFINLDAFRLQDEG